jgi:hypothetical protein
VRQPERSGLRDVSDGSPKCRAVTDRVDHLIGGIAGDDTDVVDTGFDKLLQGIEKHRFIGHRYELLGAGGGQGAKSRPLPAGEYQSLQLELAVHVASGPLPAPADSIHLRGQRTKVSRIDDPFANPSRDQTRWFSPRDSQPGGLPKWMGGRSPWRNWRRSCVASTQTFDLTMRCQRDRPMRLGEYAFAAPLCSTRYSAACGSVRSRPRSASGCSRSRSAGCPSF